MFGIGKALRRWKLYRKLSPAMTRVEDLYEEGTLFKELAGSRKLRLVIGAQLLGITVASIGAWLGFSDSTLQTILTFLQNALFAGIGGNLYEHTTDTIKRVRELKAQEKANGGTQ